MPTIRYRYIWGGAFLEFLNPGPLQNVPVPCLSHFSELPFWAASDLGWWPVDAPTQLLSAYMLYHCDDSEMLLFFRTNSALSKPISIAEGMPIYIHIYIFFKVRCCTIVTGVCGHGVYKCVPFLGYSQYQLKRRGRKKYIYFVMAMQTNHVVSERGTRFCVVDVQIASIFFNLRKKPQNCRPCWGIRMLIW